MFSPKFNIAKVARKKTNEMKAYRGLETQSFKPATKRDYDITVRTLKKDIADRKKKLEQIKGVKKLDRRTQRLIDDIHHVINYGWWTEHGLSPINPADYENEFMWYWNESGRLETLLTMELRKAMKRIVRSKESEEIDENLAYKLRHWGGSSPIGLTEQQLRHEYKRHKRGKKLPNPKYRGYED